MRSGLHIDKMNLKIALAGGGGSEDSEPIDRHFARWHGQNGKMLYIPIALRHSSRSFADCHTWIHATFAPLGVSKIEMWTDLTQHHVSELDGFDSIYIGGGNTFSLLAELRSSKFDQALHQYALAGMPIYGGSAGAVILGKDIRTVEHIDNNDIGLQQYSGLDLALGFSVWVHYQSADDVLIRSYMDKTKHNVLAISERSGVIIEGETLWSIGFESVYHFDPEKKQELSVQG